MSRFMEVEVHDRMVTKLYDRYNQLAREKSEADLALRQALALLAELQPLWMDLPPKAAESINKMLARQEKVGKTLAKEKERGSTAQGRWRWLSLNIEDIFGCTAPRNSEPADGVAKRPPPELELAELPQRGRTSSAEAAGGPLVLTSEPSFNEPVQVFFEPTALPMASSHAVDVCDLLHEAPGVAGLVAELDVLYQALRKDAERSYQEMHQRIEDLKSESQRHRERLQECYNRSVEALQAELDLCKARLAQLTEREAPRFSLAKDAQTDLCDNEWAWCQRVAEMRAKVGSAHVDWLDDTLAQRFQVAQAQLQCKERDFQKDLSSLWERKVLLTSRIRGRMTIGVGDGAAGGLTTGTEEIDQLKKALRDVEASALAPLRELATATGRDEEWHVRRLKDVISETRNQCKAATSHLGSLAQQCKVELHSRVSSANAALLAHSRLSRRHLLSTAFSAWVQELLIAGMARAEQASVAQRQEATHGDGVKANTADTIAKAKIVTEQTPEARPPRCADPAVVAAAIATVRSRSGQRLLLSSAFGFWASWQQARQLEAKQLQLEGQQAKLLELGVRLESTEAAVGFTARRPSRLLLMAIWHLWSEQRLQRMVRSKTTGEVSRPSSEAQGSLDDIRSQMLQLIDAELPRLVQQRQQQD